MITSFICGSLDDCRTLPVCSLTLAKLIGPRFSPFSSVIDEVRSLVDIFGDYEFTFWVLIDFLGD
jgi:hypothetical protein